MTKRSISIHMMSIFLAVVVLIASIGVVFDYHICQGEIKSIGVFKKAESCYVMDKTLGCLNHDDGLNEKLSKTSCCTSDQFVCKLNIESGSNFDIYNICHNINGVILPIDVSELYLPLNQSVDEPTIYRPPPIDKDFSVLYQAFLI